MSPLDFFIEFLSNPFKIGGLIPSSNALARAMIRAAETKFSSGHTLVEVGPGTGPITKHLCEFNPKPSKVVIFELNDRFYKMISEKFPEYSVVHGAIESNWSSSLDATTPKVILSSLPLFNFSSDGKKKIVDIFQNELLTNSNSVLMQYTYNHFIEPIGFESPSIRAEKVETVWANVPPATVWRYSRKD